MSRVSESLTSTVAPALQLAGEHALPARNRLRLRRPRVPDNETRFAPIPCPSCPGTIASRHCAACGELRPDLRSDGTRQWLSELAAAFTQLDGNLLRSMYALFARPGELTVEFLRGARRAYLKPIQMFLVANVVYFVMQAWLGWNTMSTPLQGHMTTAPYHEFARAHVEAFALSEGTTVDALVTAFNGRVDTYAKSLVILLVPMFAIGLALVGRMRARGFLACLVFALHFYAFFLWLQGLVLLPLAHGLARGWFGAMTWARINAVMLIPTFGATGLYLWLSFRRVFGVSKRSASVLALFSLGLFVASIFLYRFVLFLVVLHAL